MPYVPSPYVERTPQEIQRVVQRIMETLRCRVCGTASYQPNDRCPAHGENGKADGVCSTK